MSSGRPPISSFRRDRVERTSRPPIRSSNPIEDLQRCAKVCSKHRSHGMPAISDSHCMSPTAGVHRNVRSVWCRGNGVWCATRGVAQMRNLAMTG
jgi:hypothetical protein